MAIHINNAQVDQQGSVTVLNEDYGPSVNYSINGDTLITHYQRNLNQIKVNLIFHTPRTSENQECINYTVFNLLMPEFTHNYTNKCVCAFK